MKSLSLGRKLGVVWSVLIGMTVAVGAVSIFNLHRLSTEYQAINEAYLPLSDDAMELKVAVQEARRYGSDFIARQDRSLVATMDSTLTQVDEIGARINNAATKLGLDAVLAETGNITAAAGEYRASFGRVTQLVSALGDKDTGIQGDLRGQAHEIEAHLEGIGAKADRNALMVQYLLLRRHEKDFILRHDPKYVDKAREVVASLEGCRDGFVRDAANKYVTTLASLADNILTYEKEGPVMRTAATAIETGATAIEKTVREAVADRTSKLSRSARIASITVITIAGLALFIGAALAAFAIRSLTGPLRHAIASLDSGAYQIDAAAAQVAGAGQSLAQGAADQAASVESSTNVLSGISDVTNRNAEGARQAETLIDETESMVERAKGDIDKMAEAMSEISRTGAETQHIVKTIDEIAFQTNLLALNAAVEAARAGESGKGFAVVAEEVRNLARRAAEAAQNTSSLIEQSVTRINQGAQLVTTTRRNFDEIVGSTARVSGLISEIARSSKQQADGISQVSEAVSKVDRVTQQNAADAEETAAAAEQLTAQSQQMATMVKSLVEMVEGDAPVGA